MRVKGADAFFCAWLLLVAVVVLAICLRGEGYWWSIHNWHPRSLRGMGDDECDGDCFGLSASKRDTGLSAVRFPEPHLPLCHAKIVTRTCASFYPDATLKDAKSGRASIINAADLAARVGVSRQNMVRYLERAGVKNLAVSALESDSGDPGPGFVFSCKGLCTSAVAALKPGSQPPTSEVGCYYQGGTDKLICDIDLSDKALVAAARTNESRQDYYWQVDGDMRVMPEPEGKSGESSKTEADKPAELDLDTVGMLVNNLFNIFPARNVSITVETNGTRGTPRPPPNRHGPLAASVEASRHGCFENGWQPHSACSASWKYKGEHAKDMQNTQIDGCTTVGNALDGWCSPSEEWSPGMKWHSCRQCGVSWDDQARRATVTAQAYTAKAMNAMQESMSMQSETYEMATKNLKKWFGTDDKDMRAQAISGMQHILQVLSTAKYTFHPDKWVWGWVYAPYEANADGTYDIHLGQPYVETPLLSQRVGTLTHESAHFKHLQTVDHMYCDFESCDDFVSKYPAKAQNNADHWSYFIDSLNLGRMEEKPPPR